MSDYFRPLIRFETHRPGSALMLAGGPGWFSEVVHLRRGVAPVIRPVSELLECWRVRLTAPRPAIAGMVFDVPRVMGILNVTPDSFSDGGQHQTANAALTQARAMAEAGADIIDVGGESTRPGAVTVPVEAEIARIEPVIRAIHLDVAVPISIDTRKSAVAEAGVACGATLVNDISGFTYDPMLARFAADRNLPVCVMHARGDPETMHLDPQYENVLLDVYDFLESQLAKLEAVGIPRARIIVDPGIGFGKNMDHNLILLHNLSLFHGLGCPLLVGASRKGFIGKLSGAHPASLRAPGSVAAALAAVAQGAQIVRVHDVADTVQALSVWSAISKGAP